MNFASDNTGPVHPNVMAALNAANMGYALPYGADDATAQAVQDIRDVFEAPEAAGLSPLMSAAVARTCRAMPMT